MNMPLRLSSPVGEKGAQRSSSPTRLPFIISTHKKLIRRFVLALAGCLVFYNLLHLRTSSARVESSTYDLKSPQPADVHKTSFLPVKEAEELCNTQNFAIFPERERHRKIYDLFLIGTELDWLEIRLNELHRHVDYFVIVEAPRTFTNHPKPLHFKENFQRFEKFAPQIIYRQIDFLGMEDNSTWEREHFQRDSMLDSVFPSLIGPQAPRLGDVLLVSDLDEIPRPSTLTLLRNCAFPERTTLRSRFFYYSFQWEHANGDWNHPQATFYQGSATIKPEDLRMGPGQWDISNSSWHCSSCFETVAQMSDKIGSFSHTEYDRPEFKEPAEIVRRVRNGKDLFDREGEDYNKVDSRVDIPRYLMENEKRFAFMIDRDPMNANFKDYP
jgi:beta-1,4-mannosyl-glycoprotein beta-1,4-N-acetylglucosaminyltransferase